MSKIRVLRLAVILVAVLVVLGGCDFFKQLFGGGVPGTPGSLTVGGATATSLTVSWDASTDATSYQLFSDVDPKGSFTQKVYDGAETTYTDTGLSAPFSFYYKVQATSSAGSSGLSDAVGAMTVGTYAWSSFGTWILFATNETSNYGYNFYYTFSDSHLAPGGSVDTWVNKSGGLYPGDTGVIFGYQDTSNFWMFVVYPDSPDSRYGIFQKVAGAWTTWVGYTTSTAVLGWGQSNELTVDSSYTAGNDTYYLDFTINGTPITTLSQAGTPLVDQAGKTGFVAQVGLSTDESFPDNPVYNMYRQTAPVAHGGSGNIVTVPRGNTLDQVRGPAAGVPARGLPHK